MGGTIFALFAVLFSCAPTRYVRPLPKGEVAIGGAFGGPMINFGGLLIPIPFSSVQAGYGIDSTLTAFAGAGITSALFGVVQSDLGITKSILKPGGAKPGLSITPVANFNVDVYEGNFTFYPQVDVNAWWEYSKKRPDFVYVGLSNWFELQGKRAHNEPQPQRWVPSVQVGHTWSARRFDWTVETKYIAPFNVNTETVVNYANPIPRGGIGMYFTITRRLGR